MNNTTHKRTTTQYITHNSDIEDAVSYWMTLNGDRSKQDKTVNTNTPKSTNQIFLPPQMQLFRLPYFLLKKSIVALMQWAFYQNLYDVICLRATQEQNSTTIK